VTAVCCDREMPDLSTIGGIKEFLELQANKEVAVFLKSLTPGLQVLLLAILAGRSRIEIVSQFDNSFVAVDWLVGELSRRVQSWIAPRDAGKAYVPPSEPGAPIRRKQALSTGENVYILPGQQLDAATVQELRGLCS